MCVTYHNKKPSYQIYNDPPDHKIKGDLLSYSTIAFMLHISSQKVIFDGALLTVITFYKFQQFLDLIFKIKYHYGFLRSLIATLM